MAEVFPAERLRGRFAGVDLDEALVKVTLHARRLAPDRLPFLMRIPVAAEVIQAQPGQVARVVRERGHDVPC